MAFQGANTPNTSALAAAWCGKLQQFCTELQKNCSALHAIVQRKPDSDSRGTLLLLYFTSFMFTSETTALRE